MKDQVSYMTPYRLVATNILKNFTSSFRVQVVQKQWTTCYTRVELGYNVMKVTEYFVSL
jgi:chorismate-pyruvate lyase